MILYFAGNTTNEFLENDLVVTCGIQHRLLSFADAFGWATAAFEYWASDKAPRPFFLDSGAFGALTRGATINLDHYCQWIKDHEQYLACYACLDVIGNWRATARNYDRMLAHGLNPIPTYHMGSPEHELRRLCSVADYIALGGVVGAHENDMKPWLDKCFHVIHDYWPKKVHIFGVLAQWALERYPAYSADGSSALVGAGMGRVTEFKDGRMRARSWIEYAQETYDGQVMDHISNVSAKKGGSAHRGRRKVNAKAFHDLERYVTDVWTMRGITWEEPTGKKESCARSMALSAPLSTSDSSAL